MSSPLSTDQAPSLRRGVHVPDFLSFVPAGFQSGRRYVLPVADRFLPLAGQSLVRLGDLTLELDCSFPNERLIRFCGTNILKKYARSPLGQLIATLAKSRRGRFIDIGAHMGMYSIWARQCGFLATLIEPEPDAFQFLARNPQIGEAFAVALADAEGEMPFVRGASGASSSLIGASVGSDRTCMVPVRRSGQFLLECLARPSEAEIVKIDVEGAEAMVLAALGPFLREAQPVIWCEVRGALSRRAPDTCHKAVTIMSEFGYQAALPTRDGRFEPLHPGYGTQRGVFDLLFAPQGDGRLRTLGVEPAGA